MFFHHQLNCVMGSIRLETKVWSKSLNYLFDWLKNNDKKLSVSCFIDFFWHCQHNFDKLFFFFKLVGNCLQAICLDFSALMAHFQCQDQCTRRAGQRRDLHVLYFSFPHVQLKDKAGLFFQRLIVRLACWCPSTALIFTVLFSPGRISSWCRCFLCGQEALMRDGVQQRTGVGTWGNISHFGVDSTFLSTVFVGFLHIHKARLAKPGDVFFTPALVFRELCLRIYIYIF